MPKAPKKAVSKAKAKEVPFYRPFNALKETLPKRKELENTREQQGKGSTANARATESEAPRSAKPASPNASTPSPMDDFSIYMAGVKPLAEGPTRIPRSSEQVEPKVKGADPGAELEDEARKKLEALVSGGVRFEVTDDGEHVEGRRIDVEPRLLRKLRRGQFAIDSRLDLHGKRLEQAREDVHDFVKKRAVVGDRVVLIIHGKGEHSPRGMAVLRGEIGAWLSDSRASRYVAAFATAPDDLGGKGAVLVLLAR